MRKFALITLVAVAPISAADAQNMPLDQFLTKATALERKGPLALLSSDMGRLKRELQNGARELRAERLAARAAGRRQAFCPPESGGALGAGEVLSHFRSIPPAQRDQMRSKDALRSLMARKYPCPA